jgi:acetolactate synthase I/II/III large subunit
MRPDRLGRMTDVLAERATSVSGHEESTGAMLCARALFEAGVRTLFTLPGGHILSLIDACDRIGVRVIDTRHEGAAALAAEGYALATGSAGAVAVTAGPGFANGLIGLLDAAAWSVPLVYISGRTGLAQQGRGAVMDIDQRAVVAPAAKWAASCTRAGSIPRYASEAVYRARSGCPGPVYLDIPWDVVDSQVAPLDVEPSGYPAEPPCPAASPQDVGAALAALQKAERPMILAGSGVFWSGAGEDLARFAELARIPVVTASAARGVIPDSHPWCLGSLVHGGLALPHADCVMVIGSAFNANVMFGRAPLFGAEQAIIQVDIDAARIGGNRAVDVALAGDARHVLHDLTEAWRHSRDDREQWLERARALTLASVAFWDRQIDSFDGAKVHAGAVARELAAFARERFGAHVTLVADGGDALSWALAYFYAEKPGRLLSTTTALGTLGVGLPFALASKAARPDEPVLVFAGDGSFGLTAMEIDTAVRHALPIVVVVSNNAGWGDVRHEQDVAFGAGRHVASELAATRYDRFAESLGAHGEHVTELGQLRPALERSLAGGRCAVIDVDTDPSVLSELLRMVATLGLM